MIRNLLISFFWFVAFGIACLVTYTLPITEACKACTTAADMMGTLISLAFFLLGLGYAILMFIKSTDKELQ